MKNILAFVGLILILISTQLYVYDHGRLDGKINYQRSKNMQMTLDSSYHFGLVDGEHTGYRNGYVKGREDFKKDFLKLSRKEKRQWCK